MSYWTGLTYETGWGDYGNGYESGQCKLDGDRVFLRGSIGYSGTNPFSVPIQIASLPSGFAPPAVEIFAAVFLQPSGLGQGGSLIYIKIDTSGAISWVQQESGSQSVGTNQFICLDGISFSILS